MICHSDAGNGPLSASVSLADALKSIQNDSVQVSIVDVLHETTRLGFATVRLYNYLLAQNLRWNAFALKMFYKSEIIKSGALLKFSADRLYTILRNQKPDIVIFTNPWIIGYVMTALRKFPHGERPTTISLVIDIGYQLLPPSWHHPDIYSYIVPTSEAKQQLIQFGASDEQVKVLGMPVHPTILSSSNMIQAKSLRKNSDSSEYQAARKPSRILVIGGRAGTKNTLRIIEKLLQLDFELCITVLCGNNTSLKQKIGHLIARTHSRNKASVKLEGFVQDIKQHMRDADLIISKPGAMTVSEAIVMQIPMILDCDPIIMGQEVGNVSFVSANQIGIVARTVDDIPRLVTRFITDENFKAKLLENLQKFNTIGGTIDMAHYILELNDNLRQDAR